VWIKGRNRIFTLKTENSNNKRLRKQGGGKGGQPGQRRKTVIRFTEKTPAQREGGLCKVIKAYGPEGGGGWYTSLFGREIAVQKRGRVYKGGIAGLKIVAKTTDLLSRKL